MVNTLLEKVVQYVNCQMDNFSRQIIRNDETEILKIIYRVIEMGNTFNSVF